MCPPCFILWIISSNATCDPDISRPTSNPSVIPISFITSLRFSSFKLTVLVAPSFFASSSLYGFISVTTTCLAPENFTIAAAIHPIGPAPAISTSSPSASKESAVCVAFPNGSKIAYISSGMFGLHGHTLLDGITRYSANAPLRFTPTPFASLQFSLCPSRQLRHFPHVICPSPDTRSPILNPCTPSPFSTISPTYS